MDSKFVNSDNFSDIWSHFTRFHYTNKMDIWSSMTPLLIGFSALATFIAVLLGYLYLERRAVRDAVRTSDGISQFSHEEEEDEEEEVDDEDDDKPQCPLMGGWPTDGPIGEMFKDPTNLTDKERDALAFCGHIPSRVKKAQVKATVKKIEADMTEEQKLKEKEMQRKQLEAIFQMMEDQKDKFGLESVDDMSEQMRLYM